MFVQSLAAAGAGLALGLPNKAQGQAPAAGARRIKLGLDNFAVRAMKWKAPQLIEYAVSLKTDALFITDFGPLRASRTITCKEIGQADKAQINWAVRRPTEDVQEGLGHGDEHLAWAPVSPALRFPVFRWFSVRADRRTEGGIESLATP